MPGEADMTLGEIPEAMVLDRRVHLLGGAVADARAVGEARYQRALSEGWIGKGRDHATDPHKAHIEGAGCESAFAAWLPVPWDPDPNGFGKPDVAGMEVRRAWRPSHGLPVYERDKHKERLYVLVEGGFPDFEIIGWMQGHDVKRIGREQGAGATQRWSAPRSALHPPEERLREEAEAWLNAMV